MNIKLFKKRKKLAELSKKHIVFIDDFLHGVAWFKIVNEGKHSYGVINKKFEIIIEPIFEKLKQFNCGLAPFYNGVEWGFIGNKGHLKISPQFYDVGEGFSENLCPVKPTKAAHYGYINKKGIYKLPPIYQLAWNFHCGIAQVVINNEFFFINKRGKIVTESLHNYHGV